MIDVYDTRRFVVDDDVVVVAVVGVVESIDSSGRGTKGHAVTTRQCVAYFSLRMPPLLSGK